uniref:Uncharacterized protein n=1 Tax=Romanomermis culicivorax TaxID=13658 RepID=A0A915ISN4_ROMCU
MLHLLYFGLVGAEMMRSEQVPSIVSIFPEHSSSPKGIQSGYRMDEIQSSYRMDVVTLHQKLS